MTKAIGTRSDPAAVAPAAGKGAYGLVIELSAPLTLTGATISGQALRPGRYVYCGSAYGPGGLAARLRWHLRPDKTPRWHVDQLTAAGRIHAVAAVLDGDECGLFTALREVPDVEVPISGFGSSDCRRCPAHLLRLPHGLNLAGLALPWIDIRGPGLRPKFQPHRQLR